MDKYLLMYYNNRIYWIDQRLRRMPARSRLWLSLHRSPNSIINGIVYKCKFILKLILRKQARVAVWFALLDHKRKHNKEWIFELPIPFLIIQVAYPKTFAYAPAKFSSECYIDENAGIQLFTDGVKMYSTYTGSNLMGNHPFTCRV